MQENNTLATQLELIGITPEVLASLPEDFKDALHSGVLTPMICVRNEMPGGYTVEMPMKLRAEFNPDGSQTLWVYPVFDNMNNGLHISGQSFDSLKHGEILHLNGYYLQRDPETNCIIKLSDDDIRLDERLNDIEKVHDIELGSEQKDRIRNGQAVELNVGGETVTMGLDLKEPNHFKMLKGCLDDWEYQKKVAYDIQHPEYLGVVKTDENRWEWQQIVMSEKFPESLKSKPMQAQNTSMKR